MGPNRCMLLISAGGVISVMFVTEKKSLENVKVPVLEERSLRRAYLHLS